MRQIANVAAFCLLSACAAVSLRAQTPAKASGFRDMFLGQLKDVESKVTGLVEAMPEEKYNWRPEEGVRSVKEVFLHIAFANYFLPSFIGVKPPAGISPAMEKAPADKAKVLETVKNSFAYIRQVVTNLPDADLDKQTKFFGQYTPPWSKKATSCPTVTAPRQLGFFGMLVFLRPALRCVPLRFLPREPLVLELFFVAANPAGTMPSSNVNARKLERIVFIH